VLRVWDHVCAPRGGNVVFSRGTGEDFFIFWFGGGARRDVERRSRVLTLSRRSRIGETSIAGRERPNALREGDDDAFAQPASPAGAGGRGAKSRVL